MELATAIAYVKNMMLNDAQILEIDSCYPKFSSMYKRYRGILREEYRMDYDDQMFFAHWILTSSNAHAKRWQNRYRYICVDEAQDTSKIQHEIIRILAYGNNIFMVGDEDQSIYGFRAAYPKALLNFRADYNNPYILRMECNYRSTPQIVEKAQGFISENKGRYEKTMFANRDDGKPVELISVNSVEEQYLKLLAAAKNAKNETAFLYRDNESSVVLVDLFLRNGIQFRLKKPEMNFFGNSVVRDIVAYLTLAVDSHNTDSLRQICNKGVLYLKRQQLDYAVKNCNYKKLSVFDAVESQMQYLPYHRRNQAEKLKNVITGISGKSTENAIHSIMINGYGTYLKDNQQDYTKVDTLLILAKQEPNILKYLNRLTELEALIKNGINDTDFITLSTIHSSKGQEYDTVYMVDVYDGRFPSSKKNYLNRSKDSADGEQEERRLFYVGITRAKNELYLFDIKEKPSSYIDSLFPEMKSQKKSIEKGETWQERIRSIVESDRRINRQGDRLSKEEIQRRNKEYIRIQHEKKKEEELHKTEESKSDLDHYNEVKDLFTQQDTQIRDSRGVRWIMCEKCRKILPSGRFVSYGGQNHINLGMCNDCGKRRK